MMDQQFGWFLFECDAPGCDEVLDTQCDEFEEANAKRRDEGWVAKRAPGGEWEHLCPGCRYSDG